MPTNMRGLALSQLKDLNLTNEWARDYEPSGEYNYNADPFLERNGEVDSTLVKLKIVKHRILMQTLSCSHNLIRTINENFFASAIKLEKLDLSHNRIDRIPNGFLSSKHTISHVNLSFNMITAVHLTDFYNMLGLQDMRLFGNPITEIPYGFLKLSSQLKSLYLNRNSLREYVRFTCKYNSKHEIYLSGNHIKNVRSVRMFYVTSVLDVSGNLLEDLLGSDCQDISQTKILNVSSNMINTVDDSFSQIMIYLEELDISNNPLKNIQRYDIGVNTQLRKLILANSDMYEIDINISLPLNVPLIQVHVTSLCGITTRNCPYSGGQIKREFESAVLTDWELLHGTTGATTM
ncbi:hypothetical protein GJ496_000482 [Pomphorhynchus laevis]|nr:hypothetical protein GJ496_000482 [Pomphorhynchus laevis]